MKSKVDALFFLSYTEQEKNSTGPDGLLSVTYTVAASRRRGGNSTGPPCTVQSAARRNSVKIYGRRKKQADMTASRETRIRDVLI